MQKLLTVLTGLIGFSVCTCAAPITYSFSGATFNDGGVATGSFTYNSGTFSAINISVSGGSTSGSLSPATFTVFDSSTGIGNTAFFVTSAANLTGTPILSFALPPAGPGNGFSLSGFEDTCVDSVCDGFVSPARTFTAGSANAAPEPASLLLLVAGTGLLAARGSHFRRAKR